MGALVRFFAFFCDCDRILVDFSSILARYFVDLGYEKLCNEWFHFRCMNIVTQVSASSTILQPDFNFCVNALPRSLEPGSSKFLRNISKAPATHRFGNFSRPSTANGILFGSGTILSFKLEAPCCRFKSFAFKSTYSASWQAHGRPRCISSFLVDF